MILDGKNEFLGRKTGKRFRFLKRETGKEN